MYREFFTLPCSIIRGGTSKGIYFLESSLPPAGELRDKILLAAFGSPDIRQIDGLGGANSLTSKVCIIGPSQREDADVDYTFGQVSVDKAIIDWRGNCGNLTAGVGIFAIAQNLMKVHEPETTVRIYNTNSDKIIHATYKVRDGHVLSDGDYAIPGVPGTGVKILIDFLDPAGSITGKLLPTGNTKDIIDLEEQGKFTVSIVDAGNPVVYLIPEEIGLKGTELPVEVESMPKVLKLIEDIRSVAAEMIGIVPDRAVATAKSPAYPKIGFVSVPRDYVNPEGVLIKAEEVDLVARLASMQKMHRAYMITGAISTGAAAQIPGTVVHDVISERAKNSNTLIIGNPYGPMEVVVTKEGENIRREAVYRTARKILDGSVYIPYSRIYGDQRPEL
ncbi:3-methylitaconate isomerase [Pseudoflavonifractor sp. 60]|uniref:2-methylaconitate cis-trans isomerase PrpF family protein n=1 Tax=Pseudoflavonifractor sp. 60 TaxID=2304576 RepID=UPI0013680430|nr:PrpF domain-containing protein [Pseudoflavonifractor sp. 60]NBI68505.1 3-methylitaconate isomerase [Pseudoflavonifractor sp. 60]